MTTFNETLLEAQITFWVRPVPVPCSLRPVYRIALLTLLFDQCHSGQATMLQIQVLNWAVRNTANRARFLDYLRGIVSPADVIVRFDPTLTRAIDFALWEHLLEVPPESDSVTDAPAKLPIRLTEKGHEFADMLRSPGFNDVLILEKAFLDSIGRKVTQTQIERLFPKE